MDTYFEDKVRLESERAAAYGDAIVGVDEVGRGCLAGPVTAASVRLDYRLLEALPLKTLKLIRDSKKLSKAQRQKLLPTLKEISRSFHIAMATPREIERYGINPATFLAMRRTLKEHKKITYVLVDGRAKIPQIPWPQETIIKGDDKTFCIAAASILAKEARDEWMRSKAEKFPHWGFEEHVGYGTKSHLASLMEHGPCALHRRNFSPVKDMTLN